MDLDQGEDNTDCFYYSSFKGAIFLPLGLQEMNSCHEYRKGSNQLFIYSIILPYSRGIIHIARNTEISSCPR